MKSIASFVLSGLLAGAVFAQGTPPADPPADPPKEGDPKDPAEPPGPPPIVSSTEWSKTWQGARDIAAKKSGYAIMFVMETGKNGVDAPHTSRLLSKFFEQADTFRILNEQFGCWKGTMAEAQVAGAKHLADAGVKQAPAVLFVDPDNGDLVDSYVGRCTYLELLPVLQAVMDGNHRKGLEKKLAEDGGKADTQLQYIYGEACLRTGDIADARKAYTIGQTSREMKCRMNSELGLVWCDFKDKKYKETIEGAQKLFDNLPEFALEPRGTCMYLQAWSYYLQGDMDEASKIALIIREKFIRTTYGWKIDEDVIDIGYDFITKQKFTPGEKPPEAPPEEPK
ncbi:MAG: hypothetical protein AAB074_05295 [Planctomycetota bacterium]